MPVNETVMYEEQLKRIRHVLNRLQSDANASAGFLVDRNGQQIAAVGEDLDQTDSTALASLTAGNVASTDALAKLIGEPEFCSLVHEGTSKNLHLSLVNDRIILVVLFDERSSLGLVRLRVRTASGELAPIFEEIDRRQEKESAQGKAAVATAFAEITDEDIDSLFA
jgi:predicted regulator of Ras-like GTPase activity (Roadblock/LC7/MglB family)